MPTYEYECEACEHRFELFQKITAEPVKECPKCGGHVKRLIGAGAGVIFKGSGFYATDYRSESYKRELKKEKVSDTAKPSDNTKKSDKSD